MELGPGLLEKRDPEGVVLGLGEDRLVVLWPHWDVVVDDDSRPDPVHVQVDHVYARAVVLFSFEQVKDVFRLGRHGA